MIGTTAPNNMLELNGGAMSFYNPGNWVAAGMDFDSTSDALRFRSNNGSTNLNRTNMVIQRLTGNVGIGSTAPAKALDVQGSIAATGGLYVGTQGITTIRTQLWMLQRCQGGTDTCNGMCAQAPTGGDYGGVCIAGIQHTFPSTAIACSTSASCLLCVCFGRTVN